ncbi:MAG: hypothetical protein Q9192_001590 [Flavoplaca navasiana]
MEDDGKKMVCNHVYGRVRNSSASHFINLPLLQTTFPHLHQPSLSASATLIRLIMSDTNDVDLRSVPTVEHRSSDPDADVLTQKSKDQESALDPFTVKSPNESLAPTTSGMPAFFQNQRPATPDHTLVPTKPNDYDTYRDKTLATPPDSALKKKSGSGDAMYGDGQSGMFGVHAVTADQRKMQQMAHYLPFFTHSICDKVCKSGRDKTDTDIQLLQAKAERVSAELEGLRLKKERLEQEFRETQEHLNTVNRFRDAFGEDPDYRLESEKTFRAEYRDLEKKITIDNQNRSQQCYDFLNGVERLQSAQYKAWLKE